MDELIEHDSGRGNDGTQEIGIPRKLNSLLLAGA